MALPYRWQWRIERWKSLFRGFLGGGEQQPRPKICPACGALVGITATRCHECGTSLTFSLAAMSRGLSKFFGGAAPVTTSLFVLNILMYGLSLVMTSREGRGLNLLGGISGTALVELGASRADLILGGQWFRLVTAMFLHGGLIHIGCNMMVLLDIGPILEEVYGSARYFFLYVATGIFSFVVSAFLQGPVVLATGAKFWIPSVGASGALMGLIGLLLALTSRRGGAYMRALRSRLLTWVGAIFVIGFLLPGVDNKAHFGGLAAGYLLGRVFADREPMNHAEVRRAYALGWLAGLAVVASFAWMVLGIFRAN